MLSVTVPAADPSIISIEQLRAAAGLLADDTSQDANLASLGKRVTADICSDCNIVIGSGAVPTLRRETLVQTIRRPNRENVVLARRHEIEIASVVADGISLGDADYEVDPESGIFKRYDGVCLRFWRESLIVITYSAGFNEVPSDLSAAAADLARYRLSELARDPFVKSQSVEVADVETVRQDFWVGSIPNQGNSSMLPMHVASQLNRYRNAGMR